MNTSKAGGQKRRKDPNAPKKPQTAYLIFAQKERGKSKELSKMPVTEQGKIISEMWRNLSDEEKVEYNQKSEEGRVLYREEVEKYKKSPEHQDYLEKVAAGGETLKKKGKGKPRKSTGYSEFFKVVYKMVSGENPDFTMGETTSVVARRWRELSEDEKGVYNKKAEEKNIEAGLM